MKQELLSIPPLISSLVEGRGSQHLNRYYELSKRIDGHFEDIFDQLSYIRECFGLMKNKDRNEPIYRLLIQMSLISPIRVISTLSERQNGKSYFIIFYQYRDFFTVKMVVKPMTDWFKIKDVEFFSIRECTGDVYSNKLVPVSSHISSMELFKQMTFAGRRFIRYSAANRKKNVLDMVKWINNYQNIYSATCIMCHQKYNTFGKDAFMVPSLRHFDTGTAFHPCCCKGENLLKT